MTQTPEFTAWQRMHNRCANENDKSWRDYGGRGIRVHPRWDSFESFYEDMGRRPSARHSIDRVDNDRGYEPGNCRWATPSEQANNRRSSRLVTHDGVTMTVSQWAKRAGVDPGTLQDRLNKGWEPSAAIMTPVKRRHRMISFNGETKSLSDWAASIGIKPHTLTARLKAEWPLSRALVASQQNVRLLSHGGREQSLTDWAREIGVTVTCLVSRLDYYGWTVERALTTPATATNTHRKRLARR